jgi:hypothetical protein
MHRDCHNDEKRINEAGIRARFGRRVGPGRLLRLEGPAQICQGINNHRLLTQFAEAELVGVRGGDSLHIATQSAIDHPHIFVAYDSVGRPVLVPRHNTNIVMLGGPGAGKSTQMGFGAGQAAMLGDAVLILSMKDDDPVLIAQGKAGADARIEVDGQGNLGSPPFYYVSLRHGQWTMGHNYFADLRRSDRPRWTDIEEIMLTLGFDERLMSPAEIYFGNSVRQLLRQIGDMGGSPRELTQKLAEHVRKDRNADYATAGGRFKIALLGEIEQLNLPAHHRANVNYEHVHRHGGVVYVAGCYQEANSAASLAAALSVKAFCDAKRRIDPERKKHAWVHIDETQYFPYGYLAQQLAQARAEQIHTVIAQHNLEQAGDYIETVLMPSVKMIFSAVPGERTDRFLQAEFGTKRDYLFNFNRGTGANASNSFGTSVGQMGTTISSTEGYSTSNQAGYGFSERETLEWGPNDTAELNSDPTAFVLSMWPNAGCFQYGAKPILCHRAGMLLTGFAEVDRIYREVLSDTTNKIFPGKEPPKSLSAPELSPQLQAKRSAWLAAFEKTAARVREAIG